ncbi:acetolactate synthase large subunit [Pigmentiphaga soli]|uniref:Acetolactate synthase large subunit n=1 Tax=Pigmentiphaga soli TaxID=1007095 RepID=A0ABP8GLQ1_9BURK
MASRPVVAQILEALNEAGVDRIFGIAGGGPTADLISHASKAGIEFVLTQHETTAVIAAGVYGQLKGTVGVACSAIGPGVANLANGAAHAYLDRLPVLMLADRYSGGVHEVALRQQFDHLAFMKPITKAQIVLHEDTFMVGLRRAVRTALAERQGPVFIDIPGNVAGKQVGQQAYALKKADGHAPGATVNEADLRRAAQRLANSSAPLILAGLGALALPPGLLAKLAAALKAPVLTSPKAKGAIAANDPWCAGVFMGGKLEQALLDRADTIFFVGYDPVELLPRPWSMNTFVVSLDSVENTEQTFRSDIELSGGLADAAERLAQAAGRPKSGWAEHEVAAYKQHVIRAIDVDVAGMTPNAVILATREAVPEDTIMVTDVGANKLLVVELWEAYRPYDFLMSNGLATMGFCIPAAIGAKMAHPERPVVCLCGDAGFMMRLPDLLTVKKLGQHIVFVIFADDEHSLISSKQVVKGIPKGGMDFPRPDYQAMAATFGMHGVTVDNPEALKKAIAAALADRGQSTIIEARIDASGYARQFDVIREL